MSVDFDNDAAIDRWNDGALDGSQARRLEIEVQHDARDTREPYEIARDIVLTHLANQQRLNELCNPSVTSIDAVAFREAEKACEMSYSDLAVLIEDTFCVSADQLRRALAS